MYAQIIIDITNKSVDQFYDYRIPFDLINIIRPGMRVLVPFGPQRRMGLVVKVSDKSSFDASKLKDIISTYDSFPIISDEMFIIMDHLIKTSLATYSAVFQTVLPSELKMSYQDIITIKNLELIPEKYIDKFNNGIWVLTKNDQHELVQLKKLSEQKIVSIGKKITQKTTEKEVVGYTLNHHHNYPRIGNYDEVVNMFNNHEVITRQSLVEAGHQSAVATLLKNDVLKQTLIKSNRYIKHSFVTKDKKITLTKQQNDIYEFIKTTYNKNETTLLHGITGSGKTEIYLDLIADMITKNRRSLILVPEITLIAPFVSRLKARFGEDLVAILNSNLSKGERLDEWTRIINDEVMIVLGTRSAIFAPINDLGIIIIDEEHDNSYLQTEGVEYDTIRIAEIRCQHNQIPLVLGSATPRIESMYFANEGKYHKVELLERPFSVPEPNLIFIDMREELQKGNINMLSTTLEDAIRLRLEKNEQVILLLNRKGYAPFVLCRSCGYVPKCPTCNISLTYYKQENMMKCHHCNYSTPSVNVCPSCDRKAIKEVGAGIEKAAQVIGRTFPNARLSVMSQTTTTKKGSHEKIWHEFMTHQYDILLGTQMIAKGLDFNKVTLVGVLMADLSLNIPKYDAHENTYTLLKQVIGRSGRVAPGDAIIQTYNPNHYAINSANKDYNEFYLEAINLRRLSKQPPFGKISQLIITGEKYLYTHQVATLLKNDLARMVTVLGPVPSIIEKRNNRYHFILTIKYEKTLEIGEIIKKYQSNQIEVIFNLMGNSY